MFAEVETWNSMAPPGWSSSPTGMLSDQICQNSKTLLSSSCKKGIVPFAREIWTLGETAEPPLATAPPVVAAGVVVAGAVVVEGGGAVARLGLSGFLFLLDFLVNGSHPALGHLLFVGIDHKGSFGCGNSEIVFSLFALQKEKGINNGKQQKNSPIKESQMGKGKEPCFWRDLLCTRSQFRERWNQSSRCPEGDDYEKRITGRREGELYLRSLEVEQCVSLQNKPPLFPCFNGTTTFYQKPLLIPGPQRLHRDLGKQKVSTRPSGGPLSLYLSLLFRETLLATATECHQTKVSKTLKELSSFSC